MHQAIHIKGTKLSAEHNEIICFPLFGNFSLYVINQKCRHNLKLHSGCC